MVFLNEKFDSMALSLLFCVPYLILRLSLILSVKLCLSSTILGFHIACQHLSAAFWITCSYPKKTYCYFWILPFIRQASVSRNVSRKRFHTFRIRSNCYYPGRQLLSICSYQVITHHASSSQF